METAKMTLEEKFDFYISRRSEVRNRKNPLNKEVRTFLRKLNHGDVLKDKLTPKFNHLVNIFERIDDESFSELK